MKIPMDRDTPNTLISIAFLQHPTQIAASDMTCVVYSKAATIFGYSETKRFTSILEARKVNRIFEND